MIKWLLAIEAVAIAAGLTVAADLAAHKRTELVGGINVWGYRGTVAPRRHADEIRIVVVGGTRTFGWGGAAQDAIPAALYWVVSRGTAGTAFASNPVVTINLGAIGRTAAAYPKTLEHYAYLSADFVCIYDDLGLEPPGGRSRIYERFGYAPALPLVIAEKGMALRFGSVEGGYTGIATGEPSFLRRQGGAVLQLIGGTLQGLDRLPPENGEEYATAMIAAITTATRSAKAVVVAVDPANTDRARERLKQLTSRMAEAFKGTPSVSLLDLGSDPAFDQPGLTLDGYNYNASGRQRVADAIGRELVAQIQRTQLQR